MNLNEESYLVSKTEIWLRLNEVAGFTPWDNWEHIISCLRKGATYIVVKRPGKRVECKLVMRP